MQFVCGEGSDYFQICLRLTSGWLHTGLVLLANVVIGLSFGLSFGDTRVCAI